MRVAVFMSALLGVAAGLLFGMLLWGGADEAAGASGAPVARPADAEMLATLRDIRALLEQPPAGFRGAGSVPALDAAPAVVSPQPLTAGASMEEFRAALAEAVTTLRHAAAESTVGFADEVVNPTAPELLKTLLAPDGSGKGKEPQLFGASPRDVYHLLGKPWHVGIREERLEWIYTLDPKARGRQLIVNFMGGYVIGCYSIQPN